MVGNSTVNTANTLNASGASTGLVISGTTDGVENGQTVTVTIVNGSGAAVMAGLVWVMTDFNFQPESSPWLAWVTWVVAAFAGVTMVSNVPFYSFKEFNWKRRVPLWAILAAVIAYSVVATQPSLILFTLFLAYALSGYVMWALGRRVRPVLPEE
jgi:CDP-diacylglycerol--serine O-phosphatidyltransferase